MRSKSGRSFFDTNVLVYTDDARYPEKLDRASELFGQALRVGTGVASTHVLQEYFATVTRKLGVAADTARRKVENLAGLDIVQVDLPVILGAIDVHRLRQVSFSDALIVQSAMHARCARLYTEDLQHGQRIKAWRSSTLSHRGIHYDACGWPSNLTRHIRWHRADVALPLSSAPIPQHAPPVIH